MSAYVSHIADTPISLDKIVHYLAAAAEESPISNLGKDGTIVGLTLQGNGEELKALENHFLQYAEGWPRPVIFERKTVGGLDFLVVRTEIPLARMSDTQTVQAVAHLYFSDYFELSKLRVRIIAASQTNADHTRELYEGIPYQRTQTDQPCPVPTLDGTNRLAYCQMFDRSEEGSARIEQEEQRLGYPANRVTSMVTVFLKLLCDGKCGAITRESAFLMGLFGRAKISVLLEDPEMKSAQFQVFTAERTYKHRHGHWLIKTEDERTLVVTSNLAKDAVLSDFYIAQDGLIAMQNGDAYQIPLVEGNHRPRKIEHW